MSESDAVTEVSPENGMEQAASAFRQRRRSPLRVALRTLFAATLLLLLLGLTAVNSDPSLFERVPLLQQLAALVALYSDGPACESSRP